MSGLLSPRHCPACSWQGFNRGHKARLAYLAVAFAILAFIVVNDVVGHFAEWMTASRIGLFGVGLVVAVTLLGWHDVCPACGHDFQRTDHSDA